MMKIRLVLCVLFAMLLISTVVNAQMRIGINSSQQPDVFADSDPSIVFDQSHITSWYFHKKTAVAPKPFDPQIFHQNYFIKGRVWTKSASNPDIPEVHVLDMEAYNCARDTDPKWEEQTAEYIRILRMFKSYGRDAVVYGLDGQLVGAGEFQTYWNIRRHQISGNERLLKKHMAKLPGVIKSQRVIHDRFADEIDAVTISGYCPYTIPSVKSWQFQAMIYYLSEKIALRQKLYPDHPIYLWMQPNYTFSKPTRFAPIQKDVWNALVDHVKKSGSVDKVFIFTLKQYQGMPVVQSEGWADRWLTAEDAALKELLTKPKQKVK